MLKELNKDFKETAIGLIPVDWEAIKLENIVNIYLGLTYTPEYVSEGVPFLSVKDINGGVINFSKVRYISKSEFLNSTNNAKPKRGDILFGRVGTLGNPILIDMDIDFCIFVSLGFLRLKQENYDRNYLIHWMWSDIFIKQIDSEVSGSSQKNLNTGWLKKFFLTFPPLSEQKEIAQILSTWDDAIDITKKILSNLEIIKKGMTINVLSGKIRFETFLKDNKISQRNGYRIPNDWEIKNLSSVLEQVKKPVKPEKDILYKQLGIRSHAKGIFYKESVTGQSLGNKSVFAIEPDCFILNIVFAWEHAIAKTSIAELDMIVSHRFPMYKPLASKLDLDYLLFFFKSKKGKDLLGLASPGGAGRNKTLGQKEFLKLKIPIPSIKEQIAIAIFLETYDSEINLYKQKLENLQLQKKGLMQQLLTGKVRVKYN